MKTYGVIGVMSGTSLDGIDLAYCHLREEKKWEYEIIKASTVSYPLEWKNRLARADQLTGFELYQLNTEYGNLIGEWVNDFSARYSLTPNLIASHGHTVFHQPDKGISLQIGKGAAIAAKTKLPVACDFRSLDVALGGQGAPLVPIGDRLLFARYDYCLNLGGFANISYESMGKRIAFDICPANIVLNYLASHSGLSFDENGKMAASGKVNPELFSELNEISFYRKNPPKSLGKEWLEESFLPLIEQFAIPVADKLNTVVEHIAMQISKATGNSQGSLLVTGGGAYNDFLIERINHHTKLTVEIPDDKTIQYKEALIFALLGVLRMKGKINVLSSVTGARKDHSGGIIYYP